MTAPYAQRRPGEGGGAGCQGRRTDATDSTAGGLVEWSRLGDRLRLVVALGDGPGWEAPSIVDRQPLGEIIIDLGDDHEIVVHITRRRRVERPGFELAVKR